MFHTHWGKMLRRVRVGAKSAGPRRTYQARLEPLESRLVPAITLLPEPAGGVPGLAGNLVEFRKAPAGFISTAPDGLAAADNLFSLALADPNVIADATDNGVAVINYVDTGGGNVFPLPRDVGIPPLTPVKTTGAPGGPNSGTFNPLAEG